MAVSPLSQPVLPLEGVTYVPVSLGDPLFMAIESVEFVLVVAWLCVAVSNFRFTAKLSIRIEEIRAAELMKSGLES